MVDHGQIHEIMGDRFHVKGSVRFGVILLFIIDMPLRQGGMAQFYGFDKQQQGRPQTGRKNRSNATKKNQNPQWLPAGKPGNATVIMAQKPVFFNTATMPIIPISSMMVS